MRDNVQLAPDSTARRGLDINTAQRLVDWEPTHETCHFSDSYGVCVATTVFFFFFTPSAISPVLLLCLSGSNRYYCVGRNVV